MKMKKFLPLAILSLFLSPLASAAGDELGTGYSGDELGTGTPRYAMRSSAAPTAPNDAPSASDELGTGSSVASAATWWEQLLQLFR